MTGAEPLLRWIPFLPLLSALLHGLWLGSRLRPPSRWLVLATSCGTTLASAICACVVFSRLVQLPQGEGRLFDTVYTWFGAGIGGSAFSADVSFQLDALSAVMILLVTSIGLAVQVSAAGGLFDDEVDDRGFQRFFGGLDALLASMLVLVLADNLLLLFAGWTAVALASSLLMGFRLGDADTVRAGPQILRIDCLGGLAFLVALLLLFWSFSEIGMPTLSFHGFEAAIAQIAQQTLPLPGGDGNRTIRLLDVVGLCFVLAAAARSAQIPLHGWLQHSVESPTPAAAFMLSAATTASGVYLVCRLAPLYALAPLASAVLAWLGGLTALVAACLALGQHDSKRLIAYVVMAQLGMAFVAAGCGGASAAVPQLVHYCFACSLSFLAVGAIVSALRNERNVMRMGGLEKRLPKMRAVMLVGVLTLSGLPGLSGFFSREVIGVALLESGLPGFESLYALTVVTSLFVSLAIFRLYFLVFRGESRVEREVRAHLHEPANAVLNPLYTLSVLCVLGGYMALPQFWGDLIGIEASNSLGNFVATVAGSGRRAILVSDYEAGVVGTATGVWVVGAAAAWWLFVRKRAETERFGERFPALGRALRQGLGFEALFERGLARPVALFVDRVSHRGIDAGLLQRFVVDGTARAVIALARDALKFPQSGMMQGYGVVVVAAVLGLLLFMVR